MEEIILKGKKNGMAVLLLTIVLYLIAFAGTIAFAAIGGWAMILFIVCVLYLCLGWIPLMGLRVL